MNVQSAMVSRGPWHALGLDAARDLIQLLDPGTPHAVPARAVLAPCEGSRLPEEVRTAGDRIAVSMRGTEEIPWSLDHDMAWCHGVITDVVISHEKRVLQITLHGTPTMLQQLQQDDMLTLGVSPLFAVMNGSARCRGGMDGVLDVCHASHLGSSTPIASQVGSAMRFMRDVACDVAAWQVWLLRGFSQAVRDVHHDKPLTLEIPLVAFPAKPINRDVVRLNAMLVSNMIMCPMEPVRVSAGNEEQPAVPRHHTLNQAPSVVLAAVHVVLQAGVPLPCEPLRMGVIRDAPGGTYQLRHADRGAARSWLRWFPAHEGPRHGVLSGDVVCMSQDLDRHAGNHLAWVDEYDKPLDLLGSWHLAWGHVDDPHHAWDLATFAARGFAEPEQVLACMSLIASKAMLSPEEVLRVRDIETTSRRIFFRGIPRCENQITVHLENDWRDGARLARLAMGIEHVLRWYGDPTTLLRVRVVASCGVTAGFYDAYGD